jgi:hypothetical protein
MNKNIVITKKDGYQYGDVWKTSVCGIQSFEKHFIVEFKKGRGNDHFVEIL